MKRTQYIHAIFKILSREMLLIKWRYRPDNNPFQTIKCAYFRYSLP